jgi:hypothetical protein
MSIGGCCNKLFGPNGKHIKNQDGSFVAVNGASTEEKLDISDLKMPYDQVSKNRLCIEPGKSCMIGDNCGDEVITFLAIKVKYDSKLVINDDKYVEWYFQGKNNCIDNISELLVLTGTSSKPISPVVLINPSDKYKVCFEIMLGYSNSASTDIDDLYVDLGYIDLGYIEP